MTSISEAVVLMAGQGSRLRKGYGGQARLRGSDQTLLKPLIPMLGRPLICYTMEALIRAGIRKTSFIVGYQSDRMIAGIKPLIPSGFEPCFIENREWQKQNGISVLTAANHITSPFLLMMSDHLFDQSIVDLLLRSAVLDELNLAIDRKLDSIFDSDDAMKVQTRDDRLVEIGKHLATYDAIDTGFFVCPLSIFDHLERVKRDGDCSLADGVRSMASAGKVRAIDIGTAWWQDIDTPEMLVQAEEHLRARGPRTERIPKNG
jgi:choline kinase